MFDANASRLGLLPLALCLCTASACKDKPPAKPNPALANKAKVPLATQNPQGGYEILPTGSRFEPPVQKTKIPDKAWFCDMGTVHYAQLEPKDKTCPLCKMKLKQKGAGAASEHKAPPADPHGGHGGHGDHAGHGKGHDQH